LLVFRDLSEEIELQELRNDMVHMLVHDLRAPLAVVESSLVNIPAFLDEGKGETVRRLVSLSERGIHRVLDLVGDILDIARLESGNLKIQPVRSDLPLLLKDAASEIEPLASQAGIAIQVSAPSNLPRVYIDPHIMRRVLSNLLDNAVKFTPDGGSIHLWAAEGLYHPNPIVWIGVSDSGPGIPAETQKQLFEKFRQFDAPASRRAGAGLGLHFCKLAVEAHHGKISVESVLNRGSTFVIQLPLLPSRN
jgi:signal transduction histidine kinase